METGLCVNQKQHIINVKKIRNTSEVCNLVTMDYEFNPLRVKHVYTCPPCTLQATTVHAFRVHQRCIYHVLGCWKKFAWYAKG